jgi:hypothetical protein
MIFHMSSQEQQETNTPSPLPCEKFPSSSPFASFSIASHEPLRREELRGRQRCPGCLKSCKHYCYRCIELLPNSEGSFVPQLDRLPLHIFILKHAQELDSKSTAIHAKLLAPDHVSVYQFFKEGQEAENGRFRSQAETVLDESQLRTLITKDPESFVILFPDESSVQFKDFEKTSLTEGRRRDLSKIRNVIVIDGTWSQAMAINRTSPYSALPHIKLDPELKTCFWRYQNLGEHCLSTIEAIYYCIREYSESTTPQEPRGLRDYDNLLYFYSYFYHLIQDSYVQDPSRRYTSRHRLDYIKKPE